MSPERGKRHGVVTNSQASEEYAKIAKRIAIEMFFSRSFEISGVIGQELINLLSDDWGVSIIVEHGRNATIVDCSQRYPKSKVALSCGLSADYANTVSKLIQALSLGNSVCTVYWPIQDEEEAYVLATKLAYNFKADIAVEPAKFCYEVTINLKNITSNLYGSVDGQKVIVKNKHIFLEKT